MFRGKDGNLLLTENLIFFHVLNHRSSNHIPIKVKTYDLFTKRMQSLTVVDFIKGVGGLYASWVKNVFLNTVEELKCN